MTKTLVRKRDDSNLLEYVIGRCERQSGCLIWTGANAWRRDLCYGQITVDGRLQYVHRVVYTLRHGSIPAGLLVCHTCDNGLCIEDNHHFLGTHKDNADDMYGKGRCVHLSGEYAIGAKLTGDQVHEVRVLASQGLSYRMLGARYGVSHTTIRKIVAEERYVHT